MGIKKFDELLRVFKIGREITIKEFRNYGPFALDLSIIIHRALKAMSQRSSPFATVYETPVIGFGC